MRQYVTADDVRREHLLMKYLRLMPRHKATITKRSRLLPPQMPAHYATLASPTQIPTPPYDTLLQAGAFLIRLMIDISLLHFVLMGDIFIIYFIGEY